MEAELVLKSTDCKFLTTVYESPTDSITNKLITRMLFSKEQSRIQKTDGKYYYTPSSEYHRYVAEIKKTKRG